MGRVLHGSAATTGAIRRAVQRSGAGARAPVQRHAISPAAVRKRRRRQNTADPAMAPKKARSTALTPEQEAVAAAFPRNPQSASAAAHAAAA